MLAADVFHSAGIVVTDLREAQRLLSPMLGTTLAGVLFAVALLAAGQSSTITGTLAGQVVMQGFLRLRGSPMLVRLTTRAIAVFPAVILLSVVGDDATASLLVGTQVVLSLQLPFALVPLIRFTASRDVMGAYANSRTITAFASFAALLIVACNAWLVVETIGADRGPAVAGCLALLGAAALALLGYLALAPLRSEEARTGEWPRDPATCNSASAQYQPL
jgi:manganese transport protein